MTDHPVLVRCDLCHPPLRFRVQTGAEPWYVAMDHALDSHMATLRDDPDRALAGFTVTAPDRLCQLRPRDYRRTP